MSSPIRRLFVNGFPSLYGGAGTELHHQIIVWRKMGVEVHLIPSWDYHGEPLYNEMVSLGVIMHAPADWSAVQPGDPVLQCRLPQRLAGNTQAYETHSFHQLHDMAFPQVKGGHAKGGNRHVPLSE